MAEPVVGVIMGSRSDWETMQHAADTLEALGVPFETRVVSAHRTPDLLFEYASTAAERGLQVIVAGAGGAAHLPGMTAAKTHLPVLGVPVESKALKGMDSLLSIAQMPAGVPVGTLAIGRAGAVNAALLRRLDRGARRPRPQRPAAWSTAPRRPAPCSSIPTPRRDAVVTRVGIVGGGQLGRMLALAGAPLQDRLHHAGPGRGLARLAGRARRSSAPTTTSSVSPSSRPASTW